MAVSAFASPINSETKVEVRPEGTHYIWYNAGKKETVWMSNDEMAIFLNSKLKISKEKMQTIAEALDPYSVPLEDSNEFIMFVKVPLSKTKHIAIEKAPMLKQYKEVKEVSPVFYKGKKNSLNRMVLTGEIIVHFPAEFDKGSVDAFANRYGLIYIKEFAFSPNTYLFNAQSAIDSLEIANKIQLSGEVIYAYPNWFMTKSKKAIPNDPLFNNQWYLLNNGQNNGILGEDINIVNVWDNYKGSGNEVIAVVDDGVETTHEDLYQNILLDYSWDWVDNDTDPNPTKIDDNHGTAIAGIIAAKGFNGLGISGIAPEAKIIGYRLLGATTFVNIADAMLKNKDLVDISNNSWGPSDPTPEFPFVNLASLSPLIESALKEGVTTGRNRKGIIYVFAAGNGGGFDDNSNYNGYANSRYTIAVAASSNIGKRSFYSEKGSNIFINAPSNGGTLGIPTTDRTGPLGYDMGNYVYNFGGTSAATSIVSGVIALMLQANPDLSWRDVQHILANTAQKNDPDDLEWSINGAGYNINYKYGFGRINADSAIKLAQIWSPIPNEIMIEYTAMPNLVIPDNDPIGISSSITIPHNIRIEYVDIFFTSSDHPFWGDLEITLKSPSGTESILAEKHSYVVENSYNNWRFGSVRHFGESSQGTWTLTVKDLESLDVGTFQNWKLRIYGTMHQNHCSSSIYLNTSTIHIPIVKLFNNYFWVTLKYESNGLFRAINYGNVDDINLYNSCRANEIIEEADNYLLNLYSVYFDPKPFPISNVTYQATFRYFPTEDGQIWFELVDARLNQQ
jgi:kexin